VSFENLEEYLTATTPDLLQFVQNGEVRFLAIADQEATDAQGFPLDQYVPRTVSFLQCVWNVKTAEEVRIAERTQATVIYEIICPFEFDSAAIIVKSADRAELKLRIGGTAVVLEIISMIPQSNISYKIFAADLDDGSV